MRGWFHKSGKVTAATARRVTGISTPFGGLQWADPGPSERETVRGFILFLEGRRILYNPFDLEVRSQVDHSIHEIRQQCAATPRQLSEGAFAAVPVRTVGEACRRFHDDANIEFRFFDARHRDGGETPGFFMALGGLRATVGQQVALLAAHYDLDVEGDLAEVLPWPEPPGDRQMQSNFCASVFAKTSGGVRAFST